MQEADSNTQLHSAKWLSVPAH